MSAQKTDEISFNDFKRWKVPELRTFLRRRGLKITGSKGKLVALGYRATVLSAPVILTAEKGEKS